MSKFYIGTIDSVNLEKKGFSRVGKSISLMRCMNTARSEGKKFVAIQPDNPSNNSPTNMIGTCYVGDRYDPIDDQGSPNAGFEVYPVSDVNCNSNMDCIKKNTQTVLINEMTRLRQDVKKRKRDLEDVKAKMLSINNNISLSDARTQQSMQSSRERLAKQSAHLQEILTSHNKQLMALTMTSTNANEQLADKNRLLANINSNIERTYDRLGDVNDKINTATQNIYRNNMELERKEQITKTLKSIMVVMLLLFLVMVVFYGVGMARESFPDFGNKLNNAFNKYGMPENPFI